MAGSRKREDMNPDRIDPESGRRDDFPADGEVLPIGNDNPGEDMMNPRNSGLAGQPAREDLPPDHPALQSIRKADQPADSEAGNEIDLLDQADARVDEKFDAGQRMELQDTEGRDEADDLFDLFGDEFESPSDTEVSSENDRPDTESGVEDPPLDTPETDGDHANLSRTPRSSGQDESESEVVQSALESDSDHEIYRDFKPGPAFTSESESGFETDSNADVEKNTEDRDVIDLEFECPDLSDRLASPELNDSVATEAGDDFENETDGPDTDRNEQSEEASVIERGFFKILKDEKANIRREEFGDRLSDDSLSTELDANPDEDEPFEESAGVAESLESEDELDRDPLVTIGSESAERSRIDLSENAKPGLADIDMGNHPSPQKSGSGSESVSIDRSGARAKLNIQPEGSAMKWLAIAVFAILGIAVLSMGGYLFRLQSQIDELHFLLPLDQDNVFGSESPPASDLANEAVIENINARIDNLADTLELIANASQREASNVNGESVSQTGSDAPEPGAGGLASRVSAVLAGKDAVVELNRRLDDSDLAMTEIRTALSRQAQEIKALNERLQTGVVPPNSPGKVVAQPSGQSFKQKEPSAVQVPRSERFTQKKSNETAPVAAKSKIPVKPKLPPKPSIKPKASSSGAWSVNLMSLTDATIARQQLASIRGKGVSAEIKPAEISGRTWYRIRVGGFKSKQDAQKYAKAVAKKLGLASTWVTR